MPVEQINLSIVSPNYRLQCVSQLHEPLIKRQHVVFPIYWTCLRRDLGTGGAGPIAVHPHPILSQELFQVHVLKLKQASITWKGPLPEQRTQEG